MSAWYGAILSNVLKQVLRVLFVNIILTITILYLGGEAFFYLFDPFHIQTKPEAHFYPKANKDQSYSFFIRNPYISEDKVDPYIKVTRNKRGMRGEDFDPKVHKHEVFFIGGSTTECIILSDGTTWVDLLKSNLEKDPNIDMSDTWFGNGGVNGQSTFGHLFFVKEFYLKYKPKVFVFLLGANELNRFYLDEKHRPLVDFGRKKDSNYHLIHKARSLAEKQKDRELTYADHFWLFVHEYKDYSNILLNLSELRNREYTKKLANSYHHDLQLEKLNHLEVESFAGVNYEFEVKLDKLEQKEVDQSRIKEELQKQIEFQEEVKKNYLELIKISKENGILPIFITQPTLYGPGVDPTTGVNLETMIIQSGNANFGQGLTGKEMWQMTNSYNELLKTTARENNVPVIDLANLMPRDSKYYYDYIHFSKAGARKVANILSPFIKKHLKAHLKK